MPRVIRDTTGAWLVVAAAISTGLAYALVQYGPSVAVLPLALAMLAILLPQVIGRPFTLTMALVGVVGLLPVARVVVGPLPLYASDVLIALALIGVLASGGASWDRTCRLVSIYLLSWLPALLVQIVTIGAPLDATYGFLRNMLAVGVFFVGFWVATRRDGVELTRRLIQLLFVCAIVTSLIAVAQVTPGASSVAEGFLKSLSPDFAGAAYKTYPSRAFAFFTAATTLCGFLALIAALGIGSLGAFTNRARRVVVLAILAAGLGLIATYSRQWVPALGIGLAVLMLARPGRLLRVAVAGVITASLAALLLGWGALDQQYLSDRFSRLGNQDSNVQTRLERQREFLDLAEAQPGTFFVGRGFATQDLVARGAVDVQVGEQLRAGANDNVFLLEIFNHGVIAGILYVFILGSAISAGIRLARRPGPARSMGEGLLAALAVALALHFFDNYLSEAVFMKTLLWLLMGLAVGLSRRPAEGGT